MLQQILAIQPPRHINRHTSESTRRYAYASEMTDHCSCNRPENRSSRCDFCGVAVAVHTIRPPAIITSVGAISEALSVFPVSQDVRSSCDPYSRLPHTIGQLTGSSHTFHAHWSVPPFVLPVAVGHLEYASSAAGSNGVGPIRNSPTLRHVITP